MWYLGQALGEKEENGIALLGIACIVRALLIQDGKRRPMVVSTEGAVPQSAALQSLGAVDNTGKTPASEPKGL